MDVGSSSVAIETAEYCFDPQLSRGGVECDDTGNSAVGNDRRGFTDPRQGHLMDLCLCRCSGRQHDGNCHNVVVQSHFPLHLLENELISLLLPR